MQYNEKIQIANNILKDVDPSVFEWLYQVFYFDSHDFYEKACDILMEKIIFDHDLATKLAELVPHGAFGPQTTAIVTTFSTPNPFFMNFKEKKPYA